MSIFRSDWRKGKALTGGGLEGYELSFEKSADVIVVVDPSRPSDSKAHRAEASQINEGLNVKMFSILHGLPFWGIACRSVNRVIIVFIVICKGGLKMIEMIVNPWNLKHAIRQVISNKGSAGVDGMTVYSLHDYYRTHREELLSSLRGGVYLPQPIKGVEIPKGNGRFRLLGVPTVVDRMLQQAVGQVLCSHYDFAFADFSYGFRPNRNALQAVRRSLGYINGGLTYIVDIDLKTFFDEVDHCLLLQILYRKVKCRMTLRLIRKWLRAPISLNGKLVKRRKGVPQGSPLSPILSNILLNELDKKLDELGAKYVRYADDFSLYCNTEHEAELLRTTIIQYLDEKLHLPINEEKSGLRRPDEFTILGYGFKWKPSPDGHGEYYLIVSAKRWKSLKSKLKEITRKTTPHSFDTRVAKLKEVQRGWIQYFGLARIYWEVDRVDKWVRNRLRYCIWHDWKKPIRRRKSLIRLGIDAITARKWSNTRLGGWAVARSPILTTTITMARLHRRGYQSMLTIYKEITPYLNEPLYT